MPEFLATMIGFALVLFVLVCVIAACSESEADRAARLRKEYEEKITRIQEETDIKRAEANLVSAQMAHDLVVSRVKYFRKLNSRERALLEARMKASAEAEARARNQLAELEYQNQQLMRQLTALTWNGKRQQQLGATPLNTRP